MKKFLVVLVLMLGTASYCQTYTTEDKALTGVFEVAGKSKAEIFSAINKWISINYNSGKSVTQLSDAEAGNIVVKGINQTIYKNTYKILYPKSNSIPSYNPLSLNHLIEVNVKDNKYRITYRIIDYSPAIPALPYNLDDVAYQCLNFNGSSDDSILAYNNRMDSLLKMGLIGATKRATVNATTKQAFDEMGVSLIADMKKTMESINKSITTPTNDGW
ncbi:DUF4468 domain-containing protein [Flavobacterium sp. Sr18]|uniref:DUF4468 domain-containing protein n=1 Tax=Flavobacterium sp. Sr18 TaxID=935222 RepID=UPI0013E50575|nr:DUF4468 domain-containing protein [Flavobacterium sp. Sr18]QIH37893.1 DUF4468 domain-containing protein [Flavobacterium sp. Sr18]